MKDEEKVIARIDRKKKNRLFHVLLDEGITFSEWLRRQIDEYIDKKTAKKRRVKEMTDRRQEKRWTDVSNTKGKKTRERKGRTKRKPGREA